jgi:hypothetical protein
MRSYHNPDIFFQKMKKKPELQKVIDHIDEYSETELQALTGSHFPQWIRDQLVKLKNRNRKTSQAMAEEIAWKMIQASEQKKRE